jgi:hypothetical protein
MKKKNILKMSEETKNAIKKIIKTSVDQIKDLYKILRKIKRERYGSEEINLKICDNKKFMKYVNYKLKKNNEIKDKTKDNLKCMNRIKFNSYLNKMRHENELISVISKEFGSDINIVIGDWSSKGRIRFMPTPNLSLKKKLKTKFKVYHIDEYNTSKMHYKTDVECENHTVKMKTENKKILRKQLHAVLSYKKELGVATEETVERGCINRDKNSIMNMLKIIKSLLNSEQIPVTFRRKKERTALPVKKQRAEKVST